MPVTFKREDELEKILEEFASFEDLEEVVFPEPKSEEADAKKD